eukprot:3251097-Rhodomonas_salina.2
MELRVGSSAGLGAEIVGTSLKQWVPHLEKQGRTGGFRWSFAPVGRKEDHFTFIKFLEFFAFCTGYHERPAVGAVVRDLGTVANSFFLILVHPPPVRRVSATSTSSNPEAR